MVDYGRYNVDPLRYQQAGMNNLARSAQFRANEDQRKKSNALSQRRERRMADQDDFNRSNVMHSRQRQQKQDAMGAQDRDLKLFMTQAEVIGKALEGVKDEQSYQSFKGFLGQIAQSPLAFWLPPPLGQ